MWPDLAKLHHFGKYFKIFGNIFKVYLVLGKVFNSLWHDLYAIGQIFIAENGQILKTKFGHLVTLVPTYFQQCCPWYKHISYYLASRFWTAGWWRVAPTRSTWPSTRSASWTRLAAPSRAENSGHSTLTFDQICSGVKDWPVPNQPPSFRFQSSSVLLMMIHYLLVQSAIKVSFKEQ